MPGEEPFRREGRRIILRRIQHHLDHPLDIAIDRCKRADVHAKASGNGGAHLLLVQVLALDLAGLQDVLCQRLKDGFGPQVEAERFHPSNQTALPVANRGQCRADAVSRPCEVGPLCPLMDIDHNHRSSCDDYNRQSPHEQQKSPQNSR